jgi:hypothetical protein
VATNYCKRFYSCKKKKIMKMKLLAFAAIFSVLAFTSCTKDTPVAANNANAITVVPQSAVPAGIVAALNSSFAGATEVEWHKSNNHFEVEFNHQGQRHSCGFDDSGHQNSHSVSCATAVVPAVGLNAFRAKYPNDNVYEWSLKNDGSWKAHFNRNTVKWEVLFSATGAFIKEEHD